jgi:acyl-CoA synthetase (AMP-forming)/AMP-acid ligase II
LARRALSGKEIMTGALSDLLGGALGSNPHPVESIDGEGIMPCDLLALADRVRAALAAEGAAPNEPIHLRMGNRPGDIGALLGIWCAGAVAVPVHVAAASTTRERLAAATRARLLVDGDRVERIAVAAPPPRPLLDGAALVMFTSGTTGLPKGTAVAHPRLADKLAVLDRLLSLGPDDVVLLPLQMTFIFGLWVMLLTLRSGARLIPVPKFSAEAMARGLQQATVVAAVPSAYRALMLNPPAAPRLRMMMTGGEVLAPHLARALRGWSDAAIVDLYGLTETGTCDFCCGPAEQPHGFGSIGRPTPQVAWRIAAAGELQIKSPFGMLGFLDDPELTAASFADGYYKTGDLARVNEHGFVELIGRAKDIVSRGGTKIAPLEVDHLIAEHPAVAAALCAGVPDERLGEVLHAAVVRREGHELDAAALRAWLMERTERYKVPEAFYFVDALPAGSTGKADRRAVTAMAAKIRSIPSS